VRKKMFFDQLARLKENCSLLERHFSHIQFEKRESIGGLVKIAQWRSLFVVKIAHLGIFICGFSCRTASNNEEWTSRSPL
jgi:hypothetical protein